jgi:AraC-like DNA-binding protein
MPSLPATALARVPAIMLKWAEGQGVDPKALAGRVDLDRQLLKDPDTRVPVSKVWDLWQILIELFPDPVLGLEMGSRLHVREMGLVGYSIYYSSTLAEALHHIARFSRIVNETMVFHAREGAEGMRISSSTIPRFDMLRHPVDARMAWTLKALREAVGAEIVPSEADLPYPRPDDVGPYSRFFRCTPRFDQPEASMTFRKEDLARPVAASDPELVRYLDQLAESVLESLGRGATFLDRVRKEIWTDLSSGKTSVGRIAHRLGVSSRSLQRRLTDEGTSFSAEFEALRREMARKLLQDRSLAVCEVAFLLGYAEASSFYRAFRRWEKVSPFEFRRRAG